MTNLDIKNELERIWRDEPLIFPLHLAKWSINNFYKTNLFCKRIGLFYVKKGKMGKVR